MARLLSDSVSQATKRQYTRSWNLLSTMFNVELGVSLTVPVSVTNTGRFVTYLHLLGYAPSTIRTHLSAIAFVHKLQQLPDPSGHFVVKKLLGPIANSVCSAPTRLPITIDILNTLVSVLPLVLTSPYDVLMYAAMFRSLFWGFLRIGEVAVSSNPAHILCASNISVLYSQSVPVAFKITFASYKHAPPGTTAHIQVNKHDSQVTCPVQALLAYFQARGARPGHLFCTQSGASVTRQQVSTVLKACLARAHISGNYATHSFRIGAASWAADNNIPEDRIKQLGRWHSNAYKVYQKNVPSLSC